MSAADDDRRDKLGAELELQADGQAETRDVYLSGGRTLTIARHGGDELVEIRSSSGQAIAIETKRLDINASEDIEVEAQGHLGLYGKRIDLNR
jgi:hypothetical protein